MTFLWELIDSGAIISRALGKYLYRSAHVFDFS